MIIFAPPRTTAQNRNMTQRNLVVPAPLPPMTLFNPEFTQKHFDQSQSLQEKKRFAFKSKLCLVSPTTDEINMLSKQ